ncbi:hypothetical protein [Paenibacillus sp. NPDC058071]|uniref:hypothetical protein n=1 Tax=Paenibacillus sp. NPDC058071 TaxID=3346326 RepID=UPI0036DCDA67
MSKFKLDPNDPQTQNINSIRVAVIASLVSIAVTLGMSALSDTNDWAILFDAVLVMGLAFGVLMKSRTCAIILFIYFVLTKIAIAIVNPTNISGHLFSIAFIMAYWMGVKGTFGYHKLKKTLAQQQTVHGAGVQPTE